MKAVIGKKTEYTLIDIYGILLVIIGFILILPLAMIIPFWGDGTYAWCFFVPGLITISVGIILYIIEGEEVKEKQLSTNFTSLRATSIVVLAWVTAYIIGSIPFFLKGDVTFVQALFESISGWTTTGLSVLEVQYTPHIFLFFRSLTQFFGGLGFVLLMITFVRHSSASMGLYSIEGHQDKLLPNLVETTRATIKIYSGIMIGGFILYMICGMGWFDAINHSMAALSTGGFSTRADNIGYFHSIPIEAVSIVLMILGAVNFGAILLLTKGKFKLFWKMNENRMMLIVLGFAIPLVAFVALIPIYGSWYSSLRMAIFNVISALTTTGFTTTTFNSWPSFPLVIMILAMIIGGSTGSTAGGLKLHRLYVMLKTAIWNIKKKFWPELSVNEEIMFRPNGRVAINQKMIADVSNFTFVFCVVFLTGTLILTLQGNTLINSAFEFASCLSTVGISVGLTGPNTHSPTLIVEMIGMVLGRLEILAVLIAVLNIFYKINKTARKVFRKKIR